MNASAENILTVAAPLTQDQVICLRISERRLRRLGGVEEEDADYMREMFPGAFDDGGDMKFPTRPSTNWSDIKRAVWSIAGMVSWALALYYTHQGNTPESTWWNVMAFGMLMLTRTEATK